jgi:hypothetical protein
MGRLVNFVLRRASLDARGPKPLESLFSQRILRICPANTVTQVSGLRKTKVAQPEGQSWNFSGGLGGIRPTGRPPNQIHRVVKTESCRTDGLFRSPGIDPDYTPPGFYRFMPGP